MVFKIGSYVIINQSFFNGRIGKVKNVNESISVVKVCLLDGIEILVKPKNLVILSIDLKNMTITAK